MVVWPSSQVKRSRSHPQLTFASERRWCVAVVTCRCRLEVVAVVQRWPLSLRDSVVVRCCCLEVVVVAQRDGRVRWRMVVVVE